MIGPDYPILSLEFEAEGASYQMTEIASLTQMMWPQLGCHFFVFHETFSVKAYRLPIVGVRGEVPQLWFLDVKDLYQSMHS